jgi:hypothetical protein
MSGERATKVFFGSSVTGCLIIMFLNTGIVGSEASLNIVAVVYIVVLYSWIAAATHLGWWNLAIPCYLVCLYIIIVITSPYL